MTRVLLSNERELMAHITMWGSAAYPVRKLGRGWVVAKFFGVNGPPVVYRTKRAATAAFEAYLGILRDLLGEEAQARAVADLIARKVAEGLTPDEAERYAWGAVREAHEREAAEAA